MAAAFFFAVAAPAFVIACGDNKAPPKTGAPEDMTDASSASSSPPAASSSASSASSSPPAASSSAPVAESPPDAGAPSKPPVVIGETKDECTPVGVDFEKRARPKLKDCYAQGKKKNPNLEGTVKIKMTVDVKGKIKTVKVIEKTLPDPVAECMLGVVKTTPFPEVEKCWDSTLTIPITFPTPR